MTFAGVTTWVAITLGSTRLVTQWRWDYGVTQLHHTINERSADMLALQQQADSLRLVVANLTIRTCIYQEVDR